MRKYEKCENRRKTIIIGFTTFSDHKESNKFTCLCEKCHERKQAYFMIFKVGQYILFSSMNSDAWALY